MGNRDRRDVTVKMVKMGFRGVPDLTAIKDLKDLQGQKVEWGQKGRQEYAAAPAQ